MPNFAGKKKNTVCLYENSVKKEIKYLYHLSFVVIITSTVVKLSQTIRLVSCDEIVLSLLPSCGKTMLLQASSNKKNSNNFV